MTDEPENDPDALLKIFNSLDPAQAKDGTGCPPGYVMAPASAHGVFFDPKDIAKNPRLLLPMFPVPDMSSAESRRLAVETWQLQAAEHVRQFAADHPSVETATVDPDAPTSTRIVIKR